MTRFYIHIKVEHNADVLVDREILLDQIVEDVRKKAGDMAKVAGQIGKRDSYNDLMDIEDLSHEKEGGI